MTSPRLKAIEPLISELSREEIHELTAVLNARAGQPTYEPKPIDWDRFDGIIKNGPDPLEYQKAIRAEWDERGF